MARKKQVKNEAAHVDPYPDMDDKFAYIAGYTPGGAPYGVRWEDVGIDSELPFEEKVRLYMEHTNDRQICYLWMMRRNCLLTDQIRY